MVFSPHQKKHLMSMVRLKRKTEWYDKQMLNISVCIRIKNSRERTERMKILIKNFAQNLSFCYVNNNKETITIHFCTYLFTNLTNTR